MMWLEVLFSSILILSALLFYFEIPTHTQNLPDFYLYVFLSDQANLIINSNLSIFCPQQNQNICLKCSLYELDSFFINHSLFTTKEDYSSPLCSSTFSNSPKKISINRIFYHDKKLKKLVLVAFYPNT
ncbi:MAG: hypothetical protein QXV83_00630 [Candidatus Anstonellaceae archaeon]